MADETRKEFDEEQAIVPSHLILGHSLGAFPDYANMVTSETRETLSTTLRPTDKYFSALRAIGIITGFDLRGTDEAYFRDFADQCSAIVRLARAARHSERPLVMMVNFDRKRPNCDPHVEAIKQLRIAELAPEHPIHLVSYDGTILDTLQRLQAFPNVVLGFSLHPLVTGVDVLEKQPPNPTLYRDTEAFRTFLQRVPLRNVAIQSMCPLPIDDIPGHFYSPMQLTIIGNVFARFINVPGSGAALYSHSAENLRRTYNLSPELLKNLATAEDQRPDRLNLEQFLACMRALYLPAAVARADPLDQNSRRRSSVTEGSPMRGIEEGAAAAQQQHHRSQSAKGRRSPFPTTSDGRGRTSEKQRLPKMEKKEEPWFKTEEPQQSISKSTDKDIKRTSSQFGPLPTADAAKHLTSDEKKASKSPVVHRRVVLTPSPERQQPKRQPIVMSQAYVPEKSRSASTGGLRITVPQDVTFKEPYLPTRLTARQDAKQQHPRIRSPRTSSLQSTIRRAPPPPTSSRAPVQDRIQLKVPKPFTAKDTLKEFRERRSGGPIGPLPSVSVEVFAGPDPLLKPEPVLTSIIPAPTELREYFDYISPHFRHQRDERTGRMNARIDADSLASDEVPRALPAAIHITHGCGLPWDPIRVCRGDGESCLFHQTLLQAKLIGTKARWLRSGPVKDDSAYRELLDDVMHLKVHSFGQMILVKYGFRLRNDDERAGLVLKFIEEVLTADPDNLETELPRILAKYQPDIARPGLDHPWPDHSDFYRAAEHMVCYCEDVFTYTFDRLNGPASWNTNWLQSGVLPLEARQKIINEMVNKAQEHFDKLRHQLYIQFGRHHLDAADRVQFRWKRFDDHVKNRTDIQVRDYLFEPTICFVDQETKATFRHNLRDTVRMITIPEGTSAEIYAFIRRFYPAGAVQRVVLWFGRHLLLDRQHDYYDLMADLYHHFAAYFCPMQVYVVLPAFMRDRFDYWTAGPLAVFVHRDVIAPDARIVLNHLDLAQWFSDAKGLDRPLPASLDSTGRILSEVSVRKNRMTHDHDLDLWRDSISAADAQEHRVVKKTERSAPQPLSYSPPPPTSSDEKVVGGALGPLPETPTTSAGLVHPSSAELNALRILGLGTFADYVAKLREHMAVPIDARLSVIEKKLTAKEQEAEQMDDSDALSEATPDKDRESEK